MRSIEENIGDELRSPAGVGGSLQSTSTNFPLNIFFSGFNKHSKEEKNMDKKKSLTKHRKFSLGQNKH